MKYQVSRTSEERFWKKVSFGFGPDACWTWKNSIDEKGYGQFNYKSKRIRAHRVSWILNFGEIPEHRSYHGMCVLHHCDNSSCVNPKHLFLGTVQENNFDMWNKGRGVSPSNAKLSEKEVGQIRNLYEQGNITQKELGNMYGVDDTTICDIIVKRTWTHV